MGEILAAVTIGVFLIAGILRALWNLAAPWTDPNAVERVADHHADEVSL